MKIALCLSGQARCVKQTYWASIKPNILDLGNVDVFIHTWTLDESQIGKHFLAAGVHPVGEPIEADLIEKTLQLYNPAKFITEPQREFPAMPYEPRHMPGFRSELVYSMFYSIYRSNLLKVEYEQEMGITYDWVIRSRFDIATPSGPLLLSKLDNANLYIPTGGFDTIGGYLDSLAYSNSYNMDIYSDTFNHLGTILSIPDIRLCGEYILRHHLDTSNKKINVQEIGTHKLIR